MFHRNAEYFGIFLFFLRARLMAASISAFGSTLTMTTKNSDQRSVLPQLRDQAQPN